MKKTSIFGAPGVLFISILFSTELLGESNWGIECPFIGGKPSLVIRSDSPFLAFNGVGLKFAFKRDDAWIIDTIIYGGWMGFNPRLVMDGEGSPHVVFEGEALGQAYYVMYATQADSEWNIDTIAILPYYGPPQPHIALDSHGTPFVVFYASLDIYLAHLEGDTWVFTPIDTSYGTQAHPSIAIDSLDNIHIAYFDNIGHDIRYAFYDGDDWKKELVDSSGYVTTPDIQVDRWGVPHIAYYRWGAPGDLKYAVKEGDRWKVDTVSWGGSLPSLTLDAQGNPYIAHHLGEYAGGDLLFSYKIRDEWVTEIVDTLGNTGWYPSIALTSYNVPVIAYWGGHLDSLCLATRREPVGLRERLYSDLSSINFEIYPNPTHGFLYINNINRDPKNIPWMLYDIQGRLISKGRLPNSNEPLNLNTFPIERGIYFLKISDKAKPLVYQP